MLPSNQLRPPVELAAEAISAAEKLKKRGVKVSPKSNRPRGEQTPESLVGVPPPPPKIVLCEDEKAMQEEKHRSHTQRAEVVNSLRAAAMAGDITKLEKAIVQAAELGLTFEIETGKRMLAKLKAKAGK